VLYVSVFILYMVFLLMFVIFKIFPLSRFFSIHNTIAETIKYGASNYKIIPFETIASLSKKSLLKNIISFVPFGFFVFQFCKCSYIKTMLISEVFIFACEMLKAKALINYFDIDDFIRYTIGIIFGIILFRFYDSVIRKTRLFDSIKNKIYKKEENL
ncbi:MAG: VanZ family protein, partial [Oscillospiraceae bacterium]|nr:VanZ family protein [Oscillospiraceae bacterium]